MVPCYSSHGKQTIPARDLAPTLNQVASTLQHGSLRITQAFQTEIATRMPQYLSATRDLPIRQEPQLASLPSPIRQTSTGRLSGKTRKNTGSEQGQLSHPAPVSSSEPVALVPTVAAALSREPSYLSLSAAVPSILGSICKAPVNTTF